MWQDYVISICILVFIVALLPSVRGSDKPALSTSLITASVQLVLTLTYVTMELWYSVATGIVLFLLWSLLAGQVMTRDKPYRPKPRPMMERVTEEY